MLPSAVWTTLSCWKKYTYLAFFHDVCTFCLSLLTSREVWCVLRYVVRRCINIQSTEVAISACVVYIYNDFGVVTYFIVHMWQYILWAIHTHSVITCNTSCHVCIFILNICLPGTSALAQRNMFKMQPSTEKFLTLLKFSMLLSSTEINLIQCIHSKMHSLLHWSPASLKWI